MNELFDKLILRLVLALILCAVVFLYKYIHALFYPASRQQLFKHFYPSKNAADSLHFFPRILGLGIIFSGLSFNLEDGLLFAILGFMILSIISFTLYLISIYILESITLFNFEHGDEIGKKKNLCYATINAVQTLTLAMLMKVIIIHSESSLIALFFLWSLSIVLFGFSTKFYRFLSKLSFNKLLLHKNMALAFSYSGHLVGSSIIIISALNQELASIEQYSLHVVLKIILSFLILPVFQKGLIFVFKISDDHHENEINEMISAQNRLSSGSESDKDYLGTPLGYGLFEGLIFLTSCYLTTVITGNIFFGNFYPNF